MNRQLRVSDVLDLAIHESLGGRLASAAAGAGSRAWSFSVVSRLVAAAGASWRTLEAPQKIRTGALTGAVAMAIHLAMAPLGRHEPLVAVVPAVVLVACALFALFAVPIARAWERLGR
jgi:heme A synthase